MTTDPAAILTAFLTKTFGDGSVRIEFSDGQEFVSDNHAEIVDACLLDHKLDPWIDLVDAEGNAHGLSLPGDPDVVEPAPSYLADAGMVYLFEPGVVLPDEPFGKHMVPVDEILAVADPLTYALDELDISTPGSEVEVTLSQGKHRMEKQGGWKAVKSVFGQFSDALQNHTEGKKDGPCFLQGEAAGGTRKAMAMIANYIIGVDLDSGKPLDEIMDAIVSAGLEAVVYTTHSHLKDTSEIKRDHFLKWADGEEPTPALVAEYLQIKKGIIPEIVQTVEIIDDAHHTEEGVVILVRHNPIPKFRAVFPLGEPFVFAKRGGPQKDAITEWKERYAGFATAMGFFFDETCADPARLFYLPRHKKGSAFGSWWIAGKPVNLEQYERVKVRRDRRTRESGAADNAFSAFAGDEDDDEDRGRHMIGNFSLIGWAKDNAKFFEVESLLAETAPDVIRETRGGKLGVHVECPFEAEHSSFGGGGCFVVNASDNYEEGFDGGFTFNCVHDACSHRDRLDMLKGCVEEGWIAVEDLKNPAFRMEVEVEEDEPRKPTPAPAASADRPAPAKKSAPVYEEAADMDDESRNIAYFNRRYAVVSTSGGGRILVEPEDSDEDIMFYTQSDVALIERNRFIFVPGKNGKTERLEGFKHWLESEDRRYYRKVVFEPGSNVPETSYNLFRGFAIDPVRGDWSILRDHIFENICESDPGLFDWFMTWMAHLVQHPDRKPGSTIVVTGDKGTGKSTTFDYLGKLLGRHSISVSQRKQIVGNFNAHIATALLMVCEEAFWAADPQAEGTLKDMITAQEMLIEKKGYDPIKSKNFTRLVLISNNDWVVPATLKDERRFGVFRCSDARQGDIAFFEDLRRQMDKEGGLEAMMFDLLHYKPESPLGFGVLFTPPETKYLQQQQVESLTGVDKFMLELMKAGVYEPSSDNIDTIELNEDRETIVYALDLRSCILDFVRMRFASDKARTGYDDIALMAKSWFGADEFKLDVEGGMNRKRALRFPPLNDSRAQLKERKGLEVEVLATEKARKR